MRQEQIEKVSVSIEKKAYVPASLTAVHVQSEIVNASIADTAAGSVVANGSGAANPASSQQTSPQATPLPSNEG